MKKPIAYAAALLVAALIMADLPAHALEEPSYEVVSSSEDYELRRYAPYVVAQTQVRGDFSTAGNRAFRILAGYIFGRNEEQEKMAMTAPVTSHASEQDAQWVYRFVMESKYTLDSLPTPVDPRVSIKPIPGKLFAVRRFRGSWSAQNIAGHEAKLRDAIALDGLSHTGPLLVARYNPPFTPWFMRRNEVMLEVTPPQS